MSRVLLDENVPLGLRRLLTGHEVDHVTRLGWDGISNGKLVAAAERDGYQVLVTADHNLPHQQNLAQRRIALVILSTNDWDRIQARHGAINAAIENSVHEPFVTTVDLGGPIRRRPAGGIE